MSKLLTARDYDGFRALLNNRRVELNMSMIELDHTAKMPSGYSSKLLAPKRDDGSHYKRIGPDSMHKLLAALGVEIVIQPTSAGSLVLGGDQENCPQIKILRLNARKGGLASYAKMNSMERTRFARLGGIASAKKRARRKP